MRDQTLAGARESRGMPRPLLVIKFGGTSVGSPARMRRAARRVQAHVAAGRGVVVVVSAMGDATDRIVAWAGRVGGAAPGRELDRALATGEELSAALLAASLRQRGIAAVSLRGGEAGIVAEGSHGAGAVRRVEAGRLRELLAAGMVPVVAGFQGALASGETVTLGRGGSDTSAVALAGALGARCHIITDVGAVYDADPRASARARPYATLTHDELVALAASGARVVHLGAALLAREWSVPFRVYSYRAPFARKTGTYVGGNAEARPTALAGD